MKNIFRRKRHQEQNQKAIDFNEELLPEFEKMEAEDQRQYEQRIENGEENVKPKAKRSRSKKTVVAQMSESAPPIDDLEQDSKSSSQKLLNKVLNRENSVEAPVTKTSYQDRAVRNLWQELNFSPNWKDNIFHPVVVYTIIFMIIVLNAFWVVQQTFNYRAEYQTLNQLNQQEKKLETEWGRMLIEKHTFGSSGQIATRATMQMGMFSPSSQQRVVMNLPKQPTK